MQFFQLDTVDSTNDAAKRLVGQGAVRDVAYIVAREQTGGRGTRGRTWVSPRDAGLYLSLVHVAGGLSWPVTTAFTLSAALGCAAALRRCSALALRIRPINDLYVHDRKLGGILTETMITGRRVDAIITGIGINVLDVPRVLDGRGPLPTSLQAELPPSDFAALDTAELTRRMVEQVHCRYARVFAHDLEAIHREWREVVGQNPPQAAAMA